jgi:hypothetical protein
MWIIKFSERESKDRWDDRFLLNPILILSPFNALDDRLQSEGLPAEAEQHAVRQK